MRIYSYKGQTYPSVNYVKSCSFADHTSVSLRIWHPNCGMVTGGLFAALCQQIPNTGLNVSHPFLLFTSSGRVHGKALSTGANQPTVSVRTFISMITSVDIHSVEVEIQHPKVLA